MTLYISLLRTGNVIHSTTHFEGSEKDAILKSGPIRCAALDSSSKYLTTSCDDKIMKVWQVDGLELLSSRYVRGRLKTTAFVVNNEALENFQKNLQLSDTPKIPPRSSSLINLETFFPTLSTPHPPPPP